MSSNFKFEVGQLVEIIEAHPDWNPGRVVARENRLDICAMPRLGRYNRYMVKAFDPTGEDGMAIPYREEELRRWTGD